MDLELSIDRAARNTAAPSATDRAKVVWREMEVVRDSPAAVTPTPGRPPRGEIIDVTWSAVGAMTPDVAMDPDMMVTILRSERAASRVGFDHPHASDGCVFCRRAAVAYSR